MEAFFEAFDQLVDAPNAVAKMREMVLRLAFSGRLTMTGNGNDGFENWEERTIASIATSISSGFACSRSHQVPGGYVHLRTHNVSTRGTLNFDLLVRIDPARVDMKKSSLRRGDILFNNTNSQELVGKASLVDADYDYGFSNHITRIRLQDDILPGFVVYYLTLLRNSGYFARLCTRWINQAAINNQTLKAQRVPAPPLAEQRRIVAKVDELMALCDQLEAQQREREERKTILVRAALGRFGEAPTPANLQLVFHRSYDVAPAELRKAILTLAVKGKLVAQDAAGVGAISVDGAHFTRPRSSESREGAPFELPTGWQWIRLGQVGELINGDRSKNYPRKEEYVQEGVPWINTGHIKPDGTLSIDDLDHISREKFDSLRSGKVRRGDLVYCLRGTLGKTAIITQIEEGAVASSLVIIRPAPHVDSRFAYCYLASPLGRSYIYQFDNGSAQPNLSARNVKKYWVPLPPLAEQRRIVAKVDELMALVDALEAQLATARTKGSALLDAVLAELTAA